MTLLQDYQDGINPTLANPSLLAELPCLGTINKARQCVSNVPHSKGGVPLFFPKPATVMVKSSPEPAEAALILAPL